MPWLRLAVLVLVSVCALAACGSGDDNDTRTDKGDDKVTTTSEHLICGMIDASLVRKIIPSGEIGTRGPGVTDKASRALEPSHCQVQDQEKYQTVLQVTIGEVENPDHWRQKLKSEAADDEDCTTHYSKDPGHGYGCTYDGGGGVFPFGAGVNVVRGDRLIRVALYHWHDATPKERLALAEDIARDVDRNVTAYDHQHSG